MLTRVELASFVFVFFLISSTAFPQQEPRSEDPAALGGFVGGPIPDDSLALDSFAFDPFDPHARNAVKSNSGTRYCDSPDPCSLGAPVELPSGSTVHRLVLDAVDWADGLVQAGLYRCPVAQLGCFLSGFVTTSGSPGPVRVVVDLASPLVIDNENYSYAVKVGIDRGTQQATYSRLIGVKVVFDRSGPVDAFEWLPVNPLAFEPHGAGRDAVDGFERFCMGTTCSLFAPIELPSGSVVTEAILEAYDGDAAPAGYVSMYFWRCRKSTMDWESMGFGWSDTSQGLVQVSLPISPLAIDNEEYSYALQAFVLGGTIETRLAGARLVFDPPASADRWETLAIHPFAFEIESPEDATVGLNWPGRFCDGSNCLLKAPVELPTGTVIWRIGLDAFDLGAGKIVAALMRCSSASGICYSNGLIETVGTPGLTVVGMDLPVPEIVDNDSFSYVVQVYLTGGTDDTRINGIRFLYTPIWIFNDGFEFGDLLDWSNTVP